VAELCRFNQMRDARACRWCEALELQAAGSIRSSKTGSKRVIASVLWSSIICMNV
jgi:hypothetical protein